MKNLKNKSGFTLLEIIIVVIIIGVLASLALPRFFKTVEFSRSAEALNNLSTVRQSIERCFALKSGNYTPCVDLATLDVENPNTNTGRSFYYSIQASADTAYTLRAWRNTGTTASGDWIEFRVTSNGVSKQGSGNFASIN